LKFLAKVVGGNSKKGKICVFLLFLPSSTNSGYLFSVFSLLLPSKMIVNITGDDYGSILIFPVFGFLRFGPFLGPFGHFWGFWRFCWKVGGIGSASDLYDD